jgi:BNR repeat protein
MFLTSSSIRRFWLAVALSLVLALALPLSALANVPVTKISEDPYTNTTSQHKTQVEPDTFSFGSTIVAAQQTGRFFDGGSSNICWSTSTNNGASWTNGCLPGITKFQGGTFDRVSDPAVASDAQDNVWMISTLAISEAGGVHGAAILTSRSTDGGLTWGNPVTTATGADLDKNWIVCDNTASSPFYGNCYTQWDNHAASNRLQMSTSTNGGVTWGTAKSTQGNYRGLGGQPVVMPNGTVCVPYYTGGTQIGAFRSTNGGSTWSSAVLVSNISIHTVAGSLRTSPLPSAEVDAAGKVYVVWQDSGFRSGSSSNDIVMSTSTNCTTWTAKVRIPIDATNSGVDHFIPGIAVDRTTSGSTARLGLTYYYYPVASCSSSTCQLNVGFISSVNGGTSWGAPTAVAGPMTLSWLPNTSQGRMVGDYISTSYGSDGLAHGVFMVANVPTAGGTNCQTATPNCDQATYTPLTGMSLGAGSTTVDVAEPFVEQRKVTMSAADHASDNASFLR